MRILPAFRRALSRARAFPFFIALALAATAHPAWSAAPLPAGVTQGASIEGVTEYTLANGLTVLLFPDPSRAKVTVNITYRVGSRMENYGETGMAHLLEHMVFKGTPTRANIFSELGRRGMVFNGTTSYDRTNYFETFTASDENLDWALAMEADRMVNSRVSRADLDSEMTVVRNEMEMGETDPLRVLIERTTSAAYEWHSYGKSTIGARSDVEKVDIGRLQAFYRTYYQPDNAVLVIAGAFDADRALALVAKYFGVIPKPSRTLPRLYTDEPVQDGERQVTVRRVANTQWIAALYHIVPGAAPDAVALEAATDIMTLSPGGRLYAALVEARKASQVSDWFYAGRDPGFVMFFAQVPEADPIDATRQAMLATIEGVREKPVTASELDRVRARELKGFDDTFNDPQRFGVAISQAIAEGDWRLFFLRRDRWRALTPADVDRAAVAYFKTANRTVGLYLPDASPDRPPAPPIPDIAAMVKDYKGDAAVAAGEAFDATPANLDARAQRFTLASGMKIVLLPKKTRGQTINLSMRLHYGDLASVSGKDGVATLTGAMLLRGTDKHDRQAIEDTLARLKSSLAIQGGQTAATATGQTVRESLPAVLDLLAEALQSPSFPAPELETLKRSSIAGLEQSRADPRAVAERAWERYGNPYPAGDPRYVPTVEQEVAELRAPDVESLKRFHRAFYGGSYAELALVGDFDPVATRAQLERLFGAWKSPERFERVPRPLVVKKPTSETIAMPDKANAFYVGGIDFALTDRDPDYPLMLVANRIFGGAADSRLVTRVRQQEGLSYGIRSSLQVSSFEPNTQLDIIALYAPENLPRLRTAVREEIERAVKDGFSDTEVAAARAAVLEQRQLARSQDASLATALVEQAYLGRTFDYSARIDQQIASASAAQVNDAFRRYVKAADFASFYAGDFNRVSSAAKAP